MLSEMEDVAALNTNPDEKSQLLTSFFSEDRGPLGYRNRCSWVSGSKNCCLCLQGLRSPSLQTARDRSL